jgi:DNA-binding MurR/RpiR family transcriptional regulator
MTKITLSEQEFINLYKKLSITQLANLLGVSRLTIYRTAKQYGLTKQEAVEDRIVLTDKKSETLSNGTYLVNKDQFIRLYNLLTTQKLAAHYGVSRMCIWRKAKQLGLSKRYNKLS